MIAKNFLASKTIIGVLMMLIPAIGRYFGLEIGDADATQLANALVTAAGGVLAVYGRATAKGGITLGKGKSGESSGHACLSVLGLALLAACLSLPMLGCSTTGTTYTAPDACYDSEGVLCTDSVILSLVPKPTALKTTIIASVQAAISLEEISPSAVLKVCSDAKTMLAAGNTYSGVMLWLTSEVSNPKLAAVLTLVNASGLLDALATNVGDVSACDRAILLRLIEAVEDAAEALE